MLNGFKKNKVVGNVVLASSGEESDELKIISEDEDDDDMSDMETAEMNSKVSRRSKQSRRLKSLLIEDTHRPIFK